MKESLGNSMIFNLVIIFTSVIIAIVVGSISYSKAFKVKNRIVEILERYAEFNELASSDFNYDSDMVLEINDSLKNIGYKISNNSNNICPDDEGELLNSTSDYHYCVYKYITAKGPYYKVISYMSFDFPIINDMIEIPIKSETKIIYNLQGY